MSSEAVEDRFLERPVPHAADAERVILGVVLVDNSQVYDVASQLTPEDFYVPSHRHIFTAMKWLAATGQEINPVLIADTLKRNGQVEMVGGLSFITSLAYGLPQGLNLTSYITLVKEKSRLRSIFKICNKTASIALEEEDESSVILQSHASQIFNLQQNEAADTYSTAMELANASIEKVQVLAQQDSHITGVACGFGDLDSKTQGFQPTDLIIIAARPSVGKTALSLAFAQHATIREGLVVAVFSLEMGKEQVIARILCSEARVDSSRFRNGFLSPEEWERLHAAHQSLAHARLFIYDRPAVAVDYIQWKSKQLAIEQEQLDLIIVDYLQLMSGSARYTDSRQQEVSQISRDLKALAKELNVPVIANSQLSRAPENRTDHRPQLADLRESGAIEQDADVVAFIYREDEYHKGQQDYQPTNIAELILSKQRNGPTGTIDLRFDRPSTRFDNLHNDH